MHWGKHIRMFPGIGSSKAVDWIALKSSFTLRGKAKALPWMTASGKNLSFIVFLRTVLEATALH